MWYICLFLNKYSYHLVYNYTCLYSLDWRCIRFSTASTASRSKIVIRPRRLLLWKQQKGRSCRLWQPKCKSTGLWQEFKPKNKLSQPKMTIFLWLLGRFNNGGKTFMGNQNIIWQNSKPFKKIVHVDHKFVLIFVQAFLILIKIYVFSYLFSTSFEFTVTSPN